MKVAEKESLLESSIKLIGTVLEARSPILVRFTLSKYSAIKCKRIEVTSINTTGRTLTLNCVDNLGVSFTKTVLREHFEKMADKFGATLPSYITT